jgi:multidrug efflux pump subunit AcrA (membrane-fusion protein)
MALTGWWKLASVLLVAGATASGVNLLAQRETPGVAPRAQGQGNPQAARADDLPVHEVKAGRLADTIIERGSLESSRVETVSCQVEGGSTILWIVPEGTRVKKGDRVCELDSAGLKDRLIDQTIVKNRREAAYQNAKLTREVAEIAVVEYDQGIYPQDRKTLTDQIAAAQSAVRKAEARVERIRRARQRIAMASAAAEILAELDVDDRLEAAEEAVGRDKKAVELARHKLEILDKYTHAKMLKELKSEVEKRKTDELAKQAAWELEKRKDSRLRSQIESCTTYAPHDCVVVYDEPRRNTGLPPIEEGARVVQGQRFLSLPDFRSPMLVNTKVHESIVHRITPGMRARVLVDAFVDQRLTGVVTFVAPRPDPTGFNLVGQPVKVYTTLVQIDQAPEHLRPGMTAQAEILVNGFGERDNVLTVPDQACLEYDGKWHVAVKEPDGRIEWREVTLGVGNGRFVEVKQGVQSGELVIINPRALRGEEPKRARIDASARRSKSP